MPEYDTTIVAKFKDEASAKMGALTGRMQNVGGQLEGMSSHSKAFGTAIKRNTKSVGEMASGLKMLGLIGVGTMAALFMNTPFLKAGLDLVRVAFEHLFLKVSEDVVPAMQDVYDALKDITDWLEEHPWILDMIKQLVALVAKFAVVMVIVGAFGGLFLTVMGGAVAVVALFTGKWVGIIGLFKLVSARLAPLIAGLSLPMVLLGIFILGWLEGVRRNWDEIWEDIKTIVTGHVDIIKGALQILKGVFTLNFDLILEGFRTLFGGIKNIILGTFQLMIDQLQGFTEVVGDVLNQIAKIMGIKGVDFEALSTSLGGIKLLGAYNFSPNIPMAPQVAARKPTERGGRGGGETTINISFEGANFDISTADNIRDAAREFALEVNREISSNYELA